MNEFFTRVGAGISLLFWIPVIVISFAFNIVFAVIICVFMLVGGVFTSIREKLFN